VWVGGVVARVFVSHAGADAALAGEVHRWLVEDRHEVFLDQHLRDGLAVGRSGSGGCMSGCAGPTRWCAC
jgi:hypothetical protein